MRSIIGSLVVTLLFPFVASASGLSGYAVLTNTALWRGQNFTQPGAPAIGGEMMYKHETGLFVGANSLNLTAAGPFGHEFNHYIGWSTTLAEDFNLTLTYYRMYFPLGGASRALSKPEYRANLTWKNVSLFVGHMPEWFWQQGFLTTGDPEQGDKTSVNYAALGYMHEIVENWHLKGTLGSFNAGTEAVVGFKNYVHYGLALVKREEQWAFELGWSATTRQKLDGTTYTATEGAITDASDTRPYFTAVRYF